MKLVALLSAALPLIANAADSLDVHNGGVNLDPYTDDVKNYLLQKHNEARAKQAPGGAANMRQLSWNEQLAVEASELAQTCVFAHDTEGGKYGQNLMLGSNDLSHETIDYWMKLWVDDEFTDADRAGTGYLSLNHHSAILWANSYLLGCASHMCPTGYLTVCNFWPPGNWVGEQAYKPGPACSACPSDASTCVNGLCSNTGGPAPTSAPTTEPPTTAPPTEAPTTAPPNTEAPTTEPPKPTDAPTTSPPPVATKPVATKPVPADTKPSPKQVDIKQPTPAPTQSTPYPTAEATKPAPAATKPTPAATKPTPFPTAQSTKPADPKAETNDGKKPTPAPTWTAPKGKPTPAPSTGKNKNIPDATSPRAVGNPVTSDGKPTPAPSTGKNKNIPDATSPRAVGNPVTSDGKPTPAPSNGKPTPAPSNGKPTPAPSNDKHVGNPVVEDPKATSTRAMGNPVAESKSVSSDSVKQSKATSGAASVFISSFALLAPLVALLL